MNMVFNYQGKSFIKHQFISMTCPCEIVIPVNYEPVLSSVLAVQKEFVCRFSKYDPKSVLSSINRSAGKKQGILVDDETIQLLTFIDYAFVASDRLFDPTTNRLSQLWDFRNEKVPMQNEIDFALSFCGWDKVHWCKKRKKLFLPNEFSLDFGGFGKEYLCDKMVDCLRINGVEEGYVNLGGDISIIGTLMPWQFGVCDPTSTTSLASKVVLTQGALSTSGDYIRQFIKDGIRYSHIISPINGRPIKSNCQSLSVIHDTCITSGFFSTVGLLKEEQGFEWLTNSNVNFSMH